MDVLNDIVDTLELKSALYFRTDFSPPWAIRVPDYAQAARFHLVVQGRCFVTLGSGAVIDLAPGDLILIPAGRSHVISGAPETEPAPLETVLEDAEYDGAGVLAVGDGDSAASTQMVCGHFTFRAGADHPLLRALPDHLLITSGLRARYPWLDEVLRLIVGRIFADQGESTAAVTRLSEVVFIESIRACADQSPSLSGIFGALKDPQIGRALALMHEQPEAPWTVDKLASAVAMSRSRFADRFRELAGCGPMTYLSDWRLQKALGLLSSSQTSVQEIAVKTGYQSPAAFTRAFSQKLGRSPTDYRRGMAG